MNRTDCWGRALILALPATPSLAGAHKLLDGHFVALDGCATIEADSIGTFPLGCRKAAILSVANPSDPGSVQPSFCSADRMARSMAGGAGKPVPLEHPESEFVSGDGTPPPPPTPSGAVNPLTVDGSRQWTVRQKTGAPVLMAAVGGPEGFLFKTDVRER